tara:strand:- start:14399 stop:15604 length:1206 start_codon:yes stop_codon:yes gene_type:complete
MDKSLSIINAKIEATLDKVDCIGFTDEARDASQRARAMLGWPGLSQTWSQGSKNSRKQPWQKKDPKDWTQKEAKSAVDSLKQMQEDGETDSKEYKDLIIACDTFVSGDRSNDASTYQETNIMENAIEDADIPGIDGNTYVPPADDPDEEFDELKFRTGDTPYGEEGENMNDGDEDFENEERDSMEEADALAEGRRQAAEEQRRRENEQMGLDGDAEDFQFEDDEEAKARNQESLDEYNRQQEEGVIPTGDSDPDFQQQERDSMAETNTETNENQAEQSGSGDEVTEDAASQVDSDIEQAARDAEQRNMNKEANEQADLDSSQAASQDIEDLGDSDQGSSSADPQREKFNADLADALNAIDEAPNSSELRDQLRDELTDVDNYIDPRTGNELAESDGWKDDE